VNQDILTSWNSGNYVLVGTDGHELDSYCDQISMILSLFLLHYAHPKILIFFNFLSAKLTRVLVKAVKILHSWRGPAHCDIF
jgi:hypothetical protein